MTFDDILEQLGQLEARTSQPDIDEGELQSAYDAGLELHIAVTSAYIEFQQRFGAWNAVAYPRLSAMRTAGCERCQAGSIRGGSRHTCEMGDLYKGETK